MHRALTAVSEVNDMGHDVFNSQEPNVLELDGHTEEVLKVSRQVELDFVNWLCVSKEDSNQLEYRSRMCGKELKH